MDNTVFVYGTLLSCQRYHWRFLSGSTRLGRATLSGFDMLDIDTYPGIIPGEGEVLGEVYQVSDATLEALDELEELDEGTYVRQQAEVMLDSGDKIKAGIYVYNLSVEGKEKIPADYQPYTPEWRRKKDLVWYVSYGSNMLYDRFIHYIIGGQYRGGGAKHDPCADTTPPRDKKNITIKYPMYFANHSDNWDGKAVSFLDVDREGEALGVAYLITREQFLHVACQENGKRPPDGTYGWYNLIQQLDDMDGYEVYTISNTRKQLVSPPSKKYLKVLRDGLRENYPEMTEEDIKDYLSGHEGNEDWDWTFE